MLCFKIIPKWIQLYVEKQQKRENVSIINLMFAGIIKAKGLQIISTEQIKNVQIREIFIMKLIKSNKSTTTILMQ